MQRYNIKISTQEIAKWFKVQGFKPVNFENGKTHISSFWEGQSTSIKLKEKSGFDTYFKKAYGSAILVFEVATHDDVLIYEAYCPIWLFGFWNKKVSFKKDTSEIFRYRSEGYIIEERFKAFLVKNKTS